MSKEQYVGTRIDVSTIEEYLDAIAFYEAQGFSYGLVKPVRLPSGCSFVCITHNPHQICWGRSIRKDYFTLIKPKKKYKDE